MLLFPKLPELPIFSNQMVQRRRTNIVKRLSLAGWKERESVALLLGSVVLDLRDTLRSGELPEDEMEDAQRFHQEASVLWESALSTDPIVEPKELLLRLTSLVGSCPESMIPYRKRLERAVAKARTLAE